MRVRLKKIAARRVDRRAGMSGATAVDVELNLTFSFSLGELEDALRGKALEQSRIRDALHSNVLSVYGHQRPDIPDNISLEEFITDVFLPSAHPDQVKKILTAAAARRLQP